MASETVGDVRPESLLDGAGAGAAAQNRAPEEDVRYDITQAGRDALRHAEAHEKLFGPWPSLSEVLESEGLV